MNGVRNPNKRPRDKKKVSDRKKEVNAEMRFDKAYTAFVNDIQQMEELKDYYSPDVDDYECLARGFETVVKLMDKIVVKGRAAKKAYWGQSAEEEYE